ncbi:MAG: cytochrome c-type bioproteinis protein, partial [Parcubacteria group bacterium Gr01-1014_72]
MLDLSLGVAFVAGLVSFLAPCVLPLIPGFLAYLAGTPVGERGARREVFLNASAFVLGFSLVFAALGVLLNTILESVAYDVQVWLSRVGGAIIIFFGLYLTGLVKIGFLERPHTIAVQRGKYSRYVTSFLFGLAFAFSGGEDKLFKVGTIGAPERRARKPIPGRARRSAPSLLRVPSGKNPSGCPASTRSAAPTSPSWACRSTP